MDKGQAYEVYIKIGASASKYWGSLVFTDRAGKAHSREFHQENKGTRNGNTIRAMIQALSILNRACILVIHTDSDYLIYAYQNNWIWEWKENGWKNAKGQEIKNKELWQQFLKDIAKHSVKFVKEDKKNV